MVFKSAHVLGAFCLIYVLIVVESSFIKPNNVPRVGRSSESDPFDQGLMGYVIKTIPSKTIPRMGRRNFDSVNRYDIPKLYQESEENLKFLNDEDISRLTQEQENSYGSR
ncbi:uncharacterized protein LOC120625384 [Pararge aegeria]|uniref:Jg18767 protein n=1 Tax=Pararge aegeria aegeria TaxID=348720 RepID=A0A8S4S4Y9_9NEOP|nr:uncharacterized protein LOC120625384 [Pararge aegeria]CAH2249519.1 jg18767 [Pararge aegeria aegeria]